MSPPARPLIVRLRNWVGDVTLGIPTLQRLHDAGYALQLVGRRWARDLLAGHGWPVHVQPRTLRERVVQLRSLRAQARQADPGFDRRLNAVVFPYSFSSALEMRLAGLKAIGHAHEGRGLLLSRCLPRPRQRHELEVCWQLASALLGDDPLLPARVGLKPSAQHQADAQVLLQRHGIGSPFVMLCPFAGGTYDGQDKTWPDFPEFAARDLPPLGCPLLVCPGPGEEDQARRDFAGATLLPGVDLGTYAALLSRAALMISNDTGPGHMAAAVGAPLLSVLGPSDPALWRAWGPGVTLLKGEAGWPTRAQALAATQKLLAAG